MLLASSASAYDISGYILDGGTGLSGATVSINATQSTSNATGYYILSGITNGTHTITATATGYSSNTLDKTVSGANITNANITLAALTTAQQLALDMGDIAAVITSLGSIWDAMLGMVIDLMPLIIVMAILAFIVGLVAVILNKVKGKGLT